MELSARNIRSTELQHQGVISMMASISMSQLPEIAGLIRTQQISPILAGNIATTLITSHKKTGLQLKAAIPSWEVLKLKEDGL